MLGVGRIADRLQEVGVTIRPAAVLGRARALASQADREAPLPLGTSMLSTSTS